MKITHNFKGILDNEDYFSGLVETLVEDGSGNLVNSQNWPSRVPRLVCECPLEERTFLWQSNLGKSDWIMVINFTKDEATAKQADQEDDETWAQIMAES